MSALVTLFREAARKMPSHWAIAGAKSYVELDLWSDRLAGGLVGAGLRPGEAVALRMARSPQLIAWVIAVLKAGGVVFPLGTRLPPARVAALLDEAEAAWIVSDPTMPPIPPGRWRALDPLAETEAPLPSPDASRPGFIFHTSGTTGRPKAMRIGQRGILRVAHAPSYVDFGTGSRVAFLSNPAFDAFSFEIWGALLNGGTLVTFTDEEILDLDAFAAKLEHEAVTTAFLTTGLFNLMAEEKPNALLALRDVVFGGEAANPAVLHRLLAGHPDTSCRLTNGYGPTETTTFAAVHHIDPVLWADPTHPLDVPLGRPLPETEVLIAQGDGLAADEEWGEILICGTGLAEGYLGRPEETAAKFVLVDGRRAYRTGDRGRWHDDVLEYGGRLDQQVKLRGHRIEPAEIETRLAQHTGVRQAAVLSVDGQLCALVAGNVAEADLIAALAPELPAYMVPSTILVLDRLPLTSNGKLDRAAMEMLLAERGTPEDRSFLQLGGDSLKAAQLAMRLRREGKAVSVASLLSARPLAEILASAKITTPLPAALRRKRYRAASEQRRLWLVQQMQADSTAYSIPLRFDFTDAPDRAALVRGLAAIVERHAALRSAFIEDAAKTLWVEIGAPYTPGLPEIEDEDAFFAQPFDLSAGQLLRAATIGRRLVLNLHHIAVDGWSLNLILTDLAAGLKGGEMAPATDYSGYAARQAETFAEPAYTARRQARSQHLLDKPWHGDETPYLPKPGIGRIREFTLPPAQLAAAQALAQLRGDTLFSVLISAFALALWRLTGEKRLSLGVPVGLRPDGFEATVGMFVNTQICRFDATPDMTRTDWLTQAKDEAHALRDQHDVAFDHILADQRAGGQRGRLFDAMFVLENTRYELPGVAAEFRQPLKVHPRFPLTLFATPTPDGLSCQMEHDLSRLDQGKAARLEGVFADSLARLTEGFGTLGDLSSAGMDVVSAIAARAARTPGHIAVSAPDGSLTYAALMARAGGIERGLRGEGIGPGDRVGISLYPSVNVAAAVLGVMQAGAAWVPLDPDYPQERLAYLAEDSGLRLVLGDGTASLPGGLTEWNPADLPDAENAPSMIDPDALAYVIYTSGSTGKPKGVCVSHRGLANYLDHVTAQYFGQASLKGGVVSTSLNFDATITSLLGPLAAGRHVELLALGDLPALTERALVVDPLVFKVTPSHLVAMLAYADGRRGTAPHVVVVGGEQLPAALVRRLFDMLPEARVVNEYGPTETVVGCAAAWADRAHVPEWGGTMLIGRAVGGMTLSIRGANGKLASPGDEGELVIGGVSVAPGYLDRPALTAERFSALPNGTRIYRSGDLARQLPSGDFACLGRIDDQIKLNGYRIEPGEIESALLADTRVSEAAVLAHDGQLRAFVVSDAPAVELRSQLVERLSASLPAHLRPGRIEQVDALPLTANGKIDRAALLASSEPAAAIATPGDGAENGMAAHLAAAFAEVLGQPLDLDMHFFDAGAGSLALMQVHAKLRPTVPDLTLTDFFAHPTLDALARHLEARTAVPHVAPQPSIARGGKIAIIGIAAGLPDAPDLAAIWDMIRTGREAIKRGPSRASGHVNAVSSITGPTDFDPCHFGLSPREASLMDPQQRQLLMGAVKVLDHAGIDPARNPNIGLVLGSGVNSYHHALLRHGGADVSDALLATLHEKDFLATRIAHLLNLNGPALTVQTACSTSLVAVHQACQMLRAGTVEFAIAGGASIDLRILAGYQHQPGHIFSADGRCAPFSADASGTVPANGWGLIVLRPLEAAMDADDRIMAVIEGIAVNNDGAQKVGFTAPSVEGQAQVITSAMDEAGASADKLAYVEAHGTATALGDPIEVEALSRALGPAAVGGVAIGSIKSQIGHMGAGAGIAGLIRTVLALYHRTLPPSLGYESGNPSIDFERLPVRVQTRAAPWPSDRPFAGVSSFGMGGTNAHAVLSPPPAPRDAKPDGPARQVLLLGARSEDALLSRAAQVALRLAEGSDLAAMAAALSRAARNFSWRAAVVAETTDEAVALLDQIAPIETGVPEIAATPTDVISVATAWLAGLDAGRLPRPGAQAAWDLPPYPFEMHQCVHPAVTGHQTGRLPFDRWFRAPVWQRVAFPDAPALPALDPSCSPEALAPGHEIILPLAAGDGPQTLLALLARLGQAMNRSGVRLTVRSAGAFGPEGVRDPDIAMLTGLLRVVAAELPQLHPRLIDSDTDAQLPRSEHSGFAQLALRDQRLWQDTEAEIAPPPSPALPSPGRYLIIGGTGGVGRSLAARLAALPGTEVILAARHAPHDPLPPGVSVRVLDVTDKASIATLANAFSAAGNRLQGIIHAAGVTGGAASVLLTDDRLVETTRPKRAGALAILDHLAPLTDGFVLFCSSLSAREGIPGQADYAAANAWLDACAEMQTGSGPRVISVNWPAWRGVGMNGVMRAAGGRIADLAEAADAGAISEEEGWQVLLAALALDLSQLCVRPLPSGNRTEAQPAGTPSLDQITLATLFARQLGQESVGPDDSFFDLGGDSLQALDLIDEAARRGLGELPASLLSGRFTLAEAEAALAAPSISPSIDVLTLRPGGGVPILLIHPIGGDAASYRELARIVAPGRTILAIEDPALSDPDIPPRDIEDMARDYLSRIEGQIVLMGWSFGGMVAHAMATAAPERIEQLVLIDPPLPGADQQETQEDFLVEVAHRKALGALPNTAASDHPYFAALQRTWQRNTGAMGRWHPGRAVVPAVVWLALEQGACDARQAAWAELLPEGKFHRVDADHFSILRTPAVTRIAAALNPSRQSAAE